MLLAVLQSGTHAASVTLTEVGHQERDGGDLPTSTGKSTRVVGLGRWVGDGVLRTLATSLTRLFRRHSVVKVWDLRRSHSRRVNPAFVESNEDSVSNTASLRPHGISSMTLAPNGQKLYALSKDSQCACSARLCHCLADQCSSLARRIYAFDPLNLTHSTPLSVFSHPKALYGTFYIRVAVSPCSRYIASGSSEGGVYTWDTEGGGQDGVRMAGHEKETSGLDWGGKGKVSCSASKLGTVRPKLTDTPMLVQLASCSDDSLVRVWGFNSAVAMQRRAELLDQSETGSREVGWKWSGEEE